MAEIILALDLPSGGEALTLLDRLPGLRWVKLGSVLMTREGPGLIKVLQDRGLQVFLDLKWHDIPNTVAGSVSAARDHGVTLATVHTLGGGMMMEAASRAAGGELKLVGVTVLTSHDDTSLGEAIGRPDVRTGAEVVRLARQAMGAGLDGMVCSPLEIASVRAVEGPPALIVVPGIRRSDDAAGDQRRTASPEAAIAAGATHLVVGRPIIEAENPGDVLRSMLNVTI